MKILHVVASYLPATRYGGTIVSVHGLCRALAARGHDVHVFTTSVDGAADSDVPHGEPVVLDGVKVWYFRSTSWRRLYYAPALRQALRDQVAEFDVVHSHAIFLWPLWVAGWTARQFGVPHVVSLRGMLEKDLIERQTSVMKSLLIGFIEKPRLEAAAAIHVTSRRERDQAAAFGFNLPPFYEIPNGIDPSPRSAAATAPIAALAARQPFVVFLGRINWKKGLDRLIAAMPFAPSATLVIAGPDDDGYRTRVEGMAHAHEVGDRVIFTGEVLGADKHAAIELASALVLPSYSENFGNVVLEAWAQGRPVIVAPEVGLSDVVDACGGGWVAGTPESIGQAIERVVTDHRLCIDAGERGRSEAARRFSWDAVATEMEHLYATAKVHTS